MRSVTIYRLLTLGLMLLGAVAVNAVGMCATWYVRTSGDDKNNGKNPIQAFATIRKASQVAVDGDIIYVGAGTYTNDFKIDDGDKNDTDAGGILIIGDPTGAFTGDAGEVVQKGRVEVYNSNNVEFRDFVFRNVQDHVLLIEDSSDAKVKDCLFEDCEKEIKIKNGNATFDTVTIRNFEKTGIKADKGAQLVMQDCLLEFCKKGIEVKNDADEFVDDVKFVIINSTVRDMEETGIKIEKAAKSKIEMENVTISNCSEKEGLKVKSCDTVLLRNLTINGCVYGLLSEDSIITIEDSTISQNVVGIYGKKSVSMTATNVTVRDNTSWGVAYHAKTKSGKKEKKKAAGTLEATFNSCTIDDNEGGVALIDAGHGDVVFTNTVISDSNQAGIYIENSDAVLGDYTFANSQLLRNKYGIQAADSSVLTVDNFLVDQSSSYGVYITDSDAILSNVHVKGRDGVYANNGTVSLDRTTLESTFSGVANWGIVRNNGDFTVSNSLIRGFQNGIFLQSDDSSPATVANSTVVGTTGYGVYLDGGDASVTNTIVVGSPGGAGLVQNAGTLTHSYNLVDGFTTPLSGITPDPSEILQEPGFADAAGGDFRLGKGSRAINSGTTLIGILNDLDGNVRPLFKAFDMGAYEYTSPSGGFRVLSWKELK